MMLRVAVIDKLLQEACSHQNADFSVTQVNLKEKRNDCSINKTSTGRTGCFA